MSVAVVPTSMPDLGLIDSRAWAKHGVTHWHLTRTEVATNDKDRYEQGRWAQIVHGRGIEVAYSPEQAFEWLIMQRLKTLAEVQDPAAVTVRAGWATEQEWRSRAEMTWDMLTRVPRSPAGGGMAISSGRSVELYANPMTAATCRGHARG